MKFLLEIDTNKNGETTGNIEVDGMVSDISLALLTLMQLNPNISPIFQLFVNYINILGGGDINEALKKIQGIESNED